MRRKYFCVLLMTTALGAVVFGWMKWRAVDQKRVLPTPATIVPSFAMTTSSRPVLRSIDTSGFLNADRFSASWSMVSSPPSAPGRIMAGVVNHHVLASDLLARFFRGLHNARPDVRRFIIISPDHFSAGRSSVSTHERSYTFSDHVASIDASATRLLIDQGIVINEPGTMFENEHGVGALIPFALHEFHDVQIVPIAIRGTIDRESAKILGRALVPLIDAHTFVVVSSDMSHYLTQDVARKNDAQTLTWLRTLDAPHLGLATDNNTDNGVAFVVLAEIFHAKHLTPSFTLFDHSISSRYGGPSNFTTSYLTGVWSVIKK